MIILLLGWGLYRASRISVLLVNPLFVKYFAPGVSSHQGVLICSGFHLFGSYPDCNLDRLVDGGDASAFGPILENNFFIFGQAASNRIMGIHFHRSSVLSVYVVAKLFIQT